MSRRGRKQMRLGGASPHDIVYIEDILEQILSKLPVNSLLNCKLVSTYWYKLVSGPKFAELQFSSSPKSPQLILCLYDDKTRAHRKLHLMDREGKINSYVTIPPRGRNFSSQLICSFAGLIVWTKLGGSGYLDIEICNPATREVLVVPKGSPSAIIPSVGILFDPDKNKYKVLRFFCDTLETEDTKCQCEIYTPGSEDWRRVSEVMQCPVANHACPFFPTHLCIGGRMYWLVWSEDDRDVPEYILSFDMDENLTRIELPDVSGESRGLNILSFLIDYKGRLALVCVDDYETFLDIWSLTNHNESSWMFEGYAEIQIDGFVESINSIVPMENELLFIIKPGFATFFRFHFLNLDEMTWRKSKHRRYRIGKFEPVAFPYIESLFKYDQLIEESAAPDKFLEKKQTRL